MVKSIGHKYTQKNKVACVTSLLLSNKQEQENTKRALTPHTHTHAHTAEEQRAPVHLFYVVGVWELVYAWQPSASALHINHTTNSV